jgi:aspartate racemase
MQVSERPPAAIPGGGNKVLGIFGGMGPFASAEFIKTIYELNPATVEQELPRCILYSDPSLPDRTEVIKADVDAELTSRMAAILRKIIELGSDKIIICCVTSHCFLPSLPAHLREKIISLVDLIIDEVIERKRKHLLLCTDGARMSGIFSEHERWHLAEPYIVLPRGEDQEAVHNMIYQLKIDPSHDSAIPCLEGLLQKYELDSFISGCTEIHLLTKQLMNRKQEARKYSFIDPLLMVAQDFVNFLAAPRETLSERANVSRRLYR